MSKSLWLPTLISLVVLFCINILMVSSVAPSLVGKQLIAWGLGLVLFFIGKQINLKQLNSYKWPIFIICCIALLLPIVLNFSTRGSHRWIYIAGQTIQPSEFVKPMLMSFLANTSLSFLLFIPVAIIMAQPDLGSAISVLFLIIPVIFYNKKLLKFSLIAGLCLILISPLIYKYGLHDYQQKRITTFLNPKNNPLDEGYNVIQSQIAIGSGGFFGRGLGESRQKFMYIPEVWSDSIFAVVAEEVGFLFSLALISLYFYIFYQALLISQRAPDFFGKLLAGGIGIWIFWQAFINIGGATNLIPMTGVPLPFVSSGGSAIMALLMALGILANISRQAKQVSGTKQSHV